MIVSEPREEIAAWVGGRIGVSFHPPYTALAHIEVSLAADRLTLTLMRSVFHYVVHQLGCRRATARTRADNLDAQTMLARLGARLEGRQQAYFGDCDALLYAIMKEDFPYGLHAEGPEGA